MTYVVSGYIVSGYIDKPGSAVSFFIDGNRQTFEIDPVKPAFSISYLQPDIRSTGFEKIGRDYYLKDEIISLQFPLVSKWDKNRFLSWWRDAARGMGRQFTYTDIERATATVRFNSSRLPEIREVAPGFYSISINMRVC